MDCLEFNRLLDNYVNLNINEKFLLNSHAESCEKCRKELEFYKSIVLTAASLPVIEPPADLLDKVNSRIDRLPKRVTQRDRVVNNFRIYSKQYATVAACLAVGLIVGLNSSTIQDKLSRGDADGVISASTSVTDNDKNRLDDYKITDDKDVIEPEQDTSDRIVADKGDNERQDPDDKLVTEPTSAASAATAAPKAAAASGAVSSRSTPAATSANLTMPKAAATAGAAAAPRAATPRITAAPRVTVTAVPQITASPEVPAAPVITEAPVITAEPASESSKGRYTIARGNYHVPETAAAEVEITEAPATVDTEIVGERYQIAMGSYEISEDEKKALAQNKLIVNESDITEIIDCMNRSWIKGTTDGYTATSASFANFLAKLDAAGIYYNYIQMSDTGSEVYFVLLAN